jgi:hypothetical protein
VKFVYSGSPNLERAGVQKCKLYDDVVVKKDEDEDEKEGSR